MDSCFVANSTPASNLAGEVWQIVSTAALMSLLHIAAAGTSSGRRRPAARLRTDGGLGVGLELVAAEAAQAVGLANTRVADQHHLHGKQRAAGLGAKQQSSRAELLGCRRCRFARACCPALGLPSSTGHSRHLTGCGPPCRPPITSVQGSGMKVGRRPEQRRQWRRRRAAAAARALEGTAQCCDQLPAAPCTFYKGLSKEHRQCGLRAVAL